MLKQACPRKSAAPVDRLLRLLESTVELFVAPDQMAVVRVQVEHHREVYAIESQPFRDWIERTAYDRMGTLSPSVVDAAVRNFAMRARRDGGRRKVWLRAAKGKGGYYVDLGDQGWRVVEVSRGGVRALRRSPVLFVRPSTARSLPRASADGRGLQKLQTLLHVADDDWLLILAWLIEALRPDTPYVGLQIIGPQGSAKSTLQGLLRDLVDPSVENLRVKPRSREDMLIAARSNLLLSFENLSELNESYQDALCAILTGAGFAARAFFTNAEEHLISLQRPVVLNGINRVVTRPDLLDRFVTIERPEISPRARLSAARVKAHWRKLRGSAFTELLELFSDALRVLPEVAQEKRSWPRMADFAQLGEAVARATGRKPGVFLDVYTRNLAQGAEGTIESTALGAAIVAGLAHRDEFCGTYSDVSNELRRYADGAHHGGWPRSGKSFGDQLRRLAPSLNRMGFVIDLGRRTKRGYVCRLATR